MTRMGKVLLTLLVFMLACSLVIVAGSSTANTTSKDGNKQIKIKVKKLSGEIVEVLNENNDQSIPVPPAEIEQIYQSQNGFRYVGVILHTHSSPGCIYIITASGAARKVCW